MDKKEIGLRIKAFMKDRRIKQEVLGQELGLKQSSISDMVNGKRDTIRLALLIAERYSIDKNYFFDDNTQEEYPPGQLYISERISELVQEFNSDRAFALKVGIDTGNFKKKRSGTQPWTVADMNKICNSLGVRKGWLVDGEGQKFKAPDEILDTIPVVPKEHDSSGVGDILELYAQRLRLVDDLRTSLKEELEQVRIIKEELVSERDFIKGLKETLHDAIFALRSAVQQDNYRPLMAADGNNIQCTHAHKEL